MLAFDLEASLGLEHCLLAYTDLHTLFFHTHTQKEPFGFSVFSKGVAFTKALLL